MKTLRSTIPYLFTVLALGLGACASTGSGDDGETGESGETGDPLPEWMEARSGLPHDTDPQLGESDADTLVASQYALAMDLYHQLRAEPFDGKGFSISPYSIQTAFGMLWEGINDPGFDQVESTLRFDLGDPATHEALNWQDAQLQALNLEGIDDEYEKADPVIVTPANGVWALPSVEASLPAPFLDILSTHYDAGVRLADFMGDAEGERLKINEWVSIQTNGLIPELFKPGIIQATTTLVLVNALYVKAPWADPFEENATSMADFTRLDASTVSVPMMHKYDTSVRWARESEYDAVAIPLRGGGLELVAIMPTMDFDAYESALDGAGLHAAISALNYGNVELYFPRFDLKADTSLKTALEALGLIDVWPPNFDATVAGAITEVVHSTVIAVDETGVEAAAATGIVVGEDGGGGPEATLTFDRPFVLVLHDSRSGTPLFVGRVLDPSA